MSTQIKDVEAFLKRFKEKLGFWGVVFLDDRGKNFKTLTELEIRPVDRTKVLEELETVHYSEGPLEENFHGVKEMWVFGYLLNNKEIYIKITMGIPGSKCICISFHLSEFPMRYPLR